MDGRRDSWDLGEGDPITDELTAMRLLGGGEAYEAYLAFDEITYSPVVVKLLRPRQVDDASAQRGLRREVAALAAVNHPVVVRGLRHELAGPRPHVVLEHVDGPRLSSLLRRYGPLQEAQYLPLAIDVSAALHYLGHLGYVHLDIKPSNIIMGAPARLIDLSVARTVDDAASLGHPIGTDDYMAPEQCRPGESASPGPASDVWGLGTTLFEAVSGSKPFLRGDMESRAPAEIWPQLVTDPGALPERVPPEMSKIVYAALEREPADRPLPHEIAEALQPVLERQPRGHLAGFKVRR
ncbi:serine/threonine-protein kinase [Nocardioides sp. Root140]|uniref:serine/threonine-protein kinase n=1 Tax=Nocardioides sp. Root140 TaxID=1736460 RepID=UPI0006F928C5|nr:serine/threonine-protein kinase [Nocardioides sp. Root140]KQY51686.1 protein kinase [Nocardioides sp. Root140]